MYIKQNEYLRIELLNLNKESILENKHVFSCFSFRFFNKVINIMKIEENLIHELYKTYFEKYENLNIVDFDDFEKDAKAAHYEILDSLDRRGRCKEIQKLGNFLLQIENLYPDLMNKLGMTCQEFADKLVCILVFI